MQTIFAHWGTRRALSKANLSGFSGADIHDRGHSTAVHVHFSSKRSLAKRAKLPKRLSAKQLLTQLEISFGFRHSNSIDGLEVLSSELRQLKTFLKSEVERVQSEIESALAGVRIIIETIAPWVRAVRAGANIESVQFRR